MGAVPGAVVLPETVPGRVEPGRDETQQLTTAESVKNIPEP
jgi:hypothetical protein